MDAEEAVEKGLEVVKKMGYLYATVTKVFYEKGFWIVIVESIVKKFRVKIDAGGKVIEVREIKESKVVS